MGTTDAFGIDDLQAIHAVRERLVKDLSLTYRVHIHADAAIGWPWSVFNDYDFQQNDLGFRGRTLRALATADHRLRHLQLADSVGVDFHKTGFAPYISSAVLFRDKAGVRLIARDRAVMPYLFESGAYHPGMYTLETSRGAAGAMAALANLLLFGKTGLRVLLGHIVEMAEVLREALEARVDCVVVNGDNVGPVTLFRVYPDDVDTFDIFRRELHDSAFRQQLLANNDYNRRICRRVHEEALAGRGVAISMTECYRPTEHGDPIVALKSFVISPFSDAPEMHSIVERVAAAKAFVDSQRVEDSRASS